MAEQNHQSDESDVDYEKEVLQLGRIWNQIKKGVPAQTHPDVKKLKGTENEHAQPGCQPVANQSERPKNAAQKQTKPKQSKEKPVKEAAASRPQSATVDRMESTKKQGQPKRKPAYVQRNPKVSDPNVINVVTNSRPKQSTVGDRPMFMERHDDIQERVLLNPLKRADQRQIYDMKCSVEEKNQEIALLRISNNRYHDKISHLEREIQKRDEIIAQLRHNQRKIEKEKNKLYDQEVVYNFGAVEYESFKRDLKRLMHMLKTTTEYREFANLAIADDGVRFLHEANKRVKTTIDSANKQGNVLHFCTCNKAFIPEPALWVPQNVYKHAKNFVADRKGDLTPAQLELLLYDLNKMWRERERTIINSLNSIKAKEIGVYRRKLQNLNYEGNDI